MIADTTFLHDNIVLPVKERIETYLKEFIDFRPKKIERTCLSSITTLTQHAWLTDSSKIQFRLEKRIIFCNNNKLC